MLGSSWRLVGLRGSHRRFVKGGRCRGDTVRRLLGKWVRYWCLVVIDRVGYGCRLRRRRWGWGCRWGRILLVQGIPLPIDLAHSSSIVGQGWGLGQPHINVIGQWVVVVIVPVQKGRLFRKGWRVVVERCHRHLLRPRKIGLFAFTVGGWRTHGSSGAEVSAVVFNGGRRQGVGKSHD